MIRLFSILLPLLAHPSEFLVVASSVSLPFKVIDGGPNEELGGQRKILVTSRGNIETVLYHSNPGATVGVIEVAGARGGFASPGVDAYTRLGNELSKKGGLGAVLRIKYIRPARLQACVADVEDGARYLASLGIRTLGLVGHSFGGAVVVNAAATIAHVAAVATVSTQGAGMGDLIDQLGSATRPLLIIHGDADHVLPHLVSQRLFARVKGAHKRLAIVKGADHGYVESQDIRDTVYELLHGFFETSLGGGLSDARVEGLVFTEMDPKESVRSMLSARLQTARRRDRARTNDAYRG